MQKVVGSNPISRSFRDGFLSAREEPGDLPGAAIGLLVVDEVPDALERDQLGSGDLTLEAPGAAHRSELVVGSPQEQGRDDEPPEPALVRGQLLEVHRAVELERRLAPTARA